MNMSSSSIIDLNQCIDYIAQNTKRFIDIATLLQSIANSVSLFCPLTSSQIYEMEPTISNMRQSIW